MSKLINRLHKVDRVHRLIRIKGTGSPEELAEKLDISRRSVYNLINEMKALGAPIAYDASRRTFYYENEVFFEFGFFTPNKNNLSNIRGGGYGNLLASYYRDFLHHHRIN